MLWVHQSDRGVRAFSNARGVRIVPRARTNPPATNRSDSFNTRGSWLNLVKNWFGLLTERTIRRGTFHSVGELECIIFQWLARWNYEPKPLIWRASPDVILDKLRRCKEPGGTALWDYTPSTIVH